jgi:hypothetical protein
VDSELSYSLQLFELVKRETSNGRMDPNAIIEHLDVFENATARFLATAVGLVVDQLGLEGAEEALHQGIVIAISGRTHALPKTVLA